MAGSGGGAAASAAGAARQALGGLIGVMAFMINQPFTLVIAVLAYFQWQEQSAFLEGQERVIDAILGNQDPALHAHVIPRYHDEQTLPTLIGDLIDNDDASMPILEEKLVAIEALERCAQEFALLLHRQRGEDAAGVEPARAEFSEDVFPVDVAGLELRGGGVAAVRVADGAADAKAALGEIIELSAAMRPTSEMALETQAQGYGDNAMP